MAPIFQTAFSNQFSWMKMCKFRLKIRWSVFPRVQLTLFQHWFIWWCGADQATSHYLNQWWLVYWHIYASLATMIWNAMRTSCCRILVCRRPYISTRGLYDKLQLVKNIFTTLFSESFHTTIHSTNMAFHYFYISTSASSVTCSSSTTKTSPFNLAILHNKNIANAYPSFLLEEAILWYFATQN